MKNKMKDKFVELMGSAGIILWIVFSTLFVAVPILATNLPWWAMLIIYVLIVFTNIIGSIVTIGTYVYSCIVVLNSQFTIFSVVFFADLILYLIFILMPWLINLVMNFMESKR